MHILVLLLISAFIFILIKSLINNKYNISINNSKRIDLYQGDDLIKLRIFISNPTLNLNNFKVFETNKKDEEHLAIDALINADPSLKNIKKISDVVNYDYKLTIDKI